MKRFLIVLMLLTLISPVFAKTVQCVKKYQVYNEAYIRKANDVTPQIQFMIDRVGNGTEKFVKTNLNLYIKVKLNDYGKKIHCDYWKDICRDANVPYELKVDEEGYSSFQIHEFMNIFGEHAHLGAEPVLETYDVLIERR